MEVPLILRQVGQGVLEHGGVHRSVERDHDVAQRPGDRERALHRWPPAARGRGESWTVTSCFATPHGISRWRDWRQPVLLMIPSMSFAPNARIVRVRTLPSEHSWRNVATLDSSSGNSTTAP